MADQKQKPQQTLSGQYYDPLDEQWKDTLEDGTPTTFDSDLNQWTVTAPDGSRKAMVSPGNWQPTSPSTGPTGQVGQGINAFLGQPRSAELPNPLNQKPISEQLRDIVDPETYLNLLKAFPGLVNAAENPLAGRFQARDIAAQRAQQSPGFLSTIESALPDVPYFGSGFTRAMEFARRGQPGPAIGAAAGAIASGRAVPEIEARTVRGFGRAAAQTVMGVGAGRMKQSEQKHNEAVSDFLKDRADYQAGQAAQNTANQMAGQLGSLLPRLATDIKNDAGALTPTVHSTLPSDEVWSRIFRSKDKLGAGRKVPGELQQVLGDVDPRKNGAWWAVGEASDLMDQGLSPADTMVELRKRGYNQGTINSLMGPMTTKLRGGRKERGKFWDVRYEDLKSYSNIIGEAIADPNVPRGDIGALSEARDEIEKMRTELAGRDGAKTLAQHNAMQDAYAEQERVFRRDNSPYSSVLKKTLPNETIPGTKIAPLDPNDVMSLVTDQNYDTARKLLNVYASRGNPAAQAALKNLEDMRKQYVIWQKAPKKVPGQPETWDPVYERGQALMGHRHGMIPLGPFMRYVLERTGMQWVGQQPVIQPWLMNNPVNAPWRNSLTWNPFWLWARPQWRP